MTFTPPPKTGLCSNFYVFKCAPTAGSYQEMLDRLERAETVAAIRQGMEEFKRGEGILLGRAERRLRKKHGF